jgi:hypothetical protein
MGALDMGNTTEVAEIPEQKQGLAVARWATTSTHVPHTLRFSGSLKPLCFVIIE